MRFHQLHIHSTCQTIQYKPIKLNVTDNGRPGELSFCLSNVNPNPRVRVSYLTETYILNILSNRLFSLST
jgi:hypothetical protein